MPSGARIHDLARPRMPLPLRLANALARPLRASLAEASLLRAARKRSGCRDFGDEGFLEPLRVLLRALETEAGLSPLGRWLTRQHLVQLLTSRLLVEDQVRRHPELLERPVERPIVIAGLPRSGTTHLHNLISQDPALRHLPYWEGLEPVPLPGDSGEPDPRIARCQRALRLMDWAMPHFRSMHEMTWDAAHEEIQLLALEFSTMLFEATYFVPSYRAWYESHDQTGAYRYLYRALQVLQHLRRPGKRWVLKSPQHLEQLGPLMRVFPDAVVVQTHRDPVHVTASLAVMLTYSNRMQTRQIDPVATGRYWAERVEGLLRASIAGRSSVPEGQLFDVRFDEFMKDDVAMVERIYAVAGQPFGAAAEAAIRRYQDTHPPGRHGSIDYRLEDVGLDAAEIREALRFYSQRFGLE